MAKPWSCRDDMANDSIDRNGVPFPRIHFGAADAAEDEFPEPASTKSITSRILAVDSRIHLSDFGLTTHKSASD